MTFKGRKHSEETKKKISLAQTGKRKPNSGSFQKGHVPWIKGKNIFSEEKNPMWKGDKVGKTALHDWVKRKLGRPMICWGCGIKNAKIYQWANISGKYIRDIKDWKRLCIKCHAILDIKSRPRGSKHGMSKLNESKILEIRKKYMPRTYSLTKLAKEFKVDKKSILLIIKRKTWSHV